MPENLTNKQLKILKVRIDKITSEEACEKIINWALLDQKKQISTPNPEFLLETQKNPKFLKVLNNCDLNIPDGIGILWAAKYLNITNKDTNKWIVLGKWIYSLASIPFYPKYIRSILTERVTGTDLMQKISEKSSNNRIKIFLLGATDGVAGKVKDLLERKYPGLNIPGSHSGSSLEAEEDKIVKLINKSEAKILFVAFGAPKQELWIARNLHKMTTVKVAMGVGGAFDFIAGKAKRAPKWLQKLGLEWCYRLLKEPTRVKRIYNAAIKFPHTILKSSYEKNFLFEKIKIWVSSWSFFPKR